MSGDAAQKGMTARQAKTVEMTIIVFCAASLIAIFQPFSKLLSGIGMGCVVLGGLAFNLVPLCEPGRPAWHLVRTVIIIAVIFAVVFFLAIGAAHLYGVYLQTR